MESRARSPAVDDYLAQFPKPVSAQLQILREHILAASVDLEEKLGYGIPTYRWRGKSVFHFGGFARHIGLYPGPQAIEAHQAELARFKASKAAIQVPLGAPLPLDLVTRLIRFNQRALG